MIQTHTHLLYVLFDILQSVISLSEAQLVSLHKIGSNDGGTATPTCLAEEHTHKLKVIHNLFVNEFIWDPVFQF